MTKANELVDAKINFISFVKKGANGDPLRILKSDETGQGIDLSALNKADDEMINVPVTIPKNDAPATKTPEIAEEVIQKLNLMGIARAARTQVRYARQGARAGYRYARDPTGNRGRNLQTALGHAFRSNAGGVGMIAGATTGRGVTLAARRVAAARATGRRIGVGLRAGHGLARAVANGRSVSPNSTAARAFIAARAAGSRRSLNVGVRAGIAHNYAERGARGLRTWVTNARVNGGGFWRRNRA